MHVPCPGMHVGGIGQEHAPQPQVELHVCIPYMLHFCDVPGAQPCPLHDPCAQLPVESHVSISVPQLPHVTVCIPPGAQTPEHAPLTHVCATQFTLEPHWPSAPQVKTALALVEHSVAPGVHTPWHEPPMHTNWQAAGVPHWPPELHVSTPLFEHWVVPGEHEPAHIPPVHTLGHDEPVFFHVPLVVQVWG
jgi:hypothetical protein